MWELKRIENNITPTKVIIGVMQLNYQISISTSSCTWITLFSKTTQAQRNEKRKYRP